jgi:hypothetical protein
MYSSCIRGHNFDICIIDSVVVSHKTCFHSVKWLDARRRKNEVMKILSPKGILSTDFHFRSSDHKNIKSQRIGFYWYTTTQAVLFIRNWYIENATTQITNTRKTVILHTSKVLNF